MEMSYKHYIYTHTRLKAHLAVTLTKDRANVTDLGLVELKVRPNQVWASSSPADACLSHGHPRADYPGGYWN
jgi:hypothetical protein